MSRLLLIFPLYRISLEENDELNDKTIANAIDLIKTGQVSYIFTTNANQLNDTITKILNDNNMLWRNFNAKNQR